MRRYPWLAAYGVLSAVIAVVVGSLSLVAAVGVYLTLAERREGVAALAAAGVAVGGLFAAITIGVAADVARWMLDVVRLLDAHRNAHGRGD